MRAEVTLCTHVRRLHFKHGRSFKMSPINFRKLAVSLAMFAVVALGSSAVAKADSVYILTNSNFAGNGNFGTVTTHLNLNGTIRVDVNLAAGYVIHGNGFGFNVVGDTTGLAITVNNPAALFQTGPTGQQFDGFGNFEFSVESLQSTAQARATNTNSLTFTVSRTVGFTNDNQLAELNPNWFFAVQIAPLDTTAATGFAAGASAVPEPASMLLLGTGLLGVAAGFRKRIRK
jgi:hypothetical protein